MEHAHESTNHVDVVIEHPEKSSRLLAVGTLLFLIPKFFILIPHFLALYFLSFLSIILGIFAQFAVLFTGKYPHGIFDIVKGLLRWKLRVNSYIFGLTDKYPPFKLNS